MRLAELGAEIAISTDELHARGPMVIQELTGPEGRKKLAGGAASLRAERPDPTYDRPRPGGAQEPSRIGAVRDSRPWGPSGARTLWVGNPVVPLPKPRCTTG